MTTLDILFQNEHFVVVRKPAGWLSVPSRDKEDPRPCVGLELQKQLACHLLPCHRLDFEVSGLLMFAKASDAHRSANQWFEHHSITKFYAALTQGEIDIAGKFKVKQLVKSNLVRGKKRTFSAPHGQPAETYIQFIETRTINNIPVFFWHLEPLTGRSHQLRFEMSRLQSPILGDQLYGSNYFVGEHTIALQAVGIDFRNASNHAHYGLPDIIKIPFIFPEKITQVSS